MEINLNFVLFEGPKKSQMAAEPERIS